MPIGIIFNSSAIVIGGIIGAVIGEKLTADFKEKVNMIFGVCAMGMGIQSIVLMENMPAVIFAMIFGTVLCQRDGHIWFLDFGDEQRPQHFDCKIHSGFVYGPDFCVYAGRGRGGYRDSPICYFFAVVFGCGCYIPLDDADDD